MPRLSRPSVYREDLAERILFRLADGESLSEISRSPDMPSKGTIGTWVMRNHNDFRPRYFEAVGARMVVELDRILEIVDGVADSNSMAAVQAARTRYDARRWLAGKLLAEFGERYLHTHQVGATVQVLLPDNGRLGNNAPLLEGSAQLIRDNDQQGTD